MSLRCGEKYFAHIYSTFTLHTQHHRKRYVSEHIKIASSILHLALPQWNKHWCIVKFQIHVPTHKTRMNKKTEESRIYAVKRNEYCKCNTKTKTEEENHWQKWNRNKAKPAKIIDNNWMHIEQSYEKPTEIMIYFFPISYGLEFITENLANTLRI